MVVFNYITLKSLLPFGWKILKAKNDWGESQLFIMNRSGERFETLEEAQDDILKEKKDPWKDLGSMIMEERYKAEERKEIIGEEWRKISRILDRFLLIIFTLASLITTLW